MTCNNDYCEIERTDTKQEDYPTKRNLDGCYFRVERDGKWTNLCFSDMTDTERGKDVPEVAPGLDVLPPQSGEVLDNHAVHFPRRDVVHHSLERGTVKNDPAVSVVHLRGNKLNVRVFCQIIPHQLFLVGNAVALRVVVIRVRKPQILRCPVSRHGKRTPF